MEAPNITMDSPSELENKNSSLESTETPETGVLDSESQVSDKPNPQAPLLTKPFVKNVDTAKIELDGLDWLDVKKTNYKAPPAVAFKVDETAKKLATDAKKFELEKKSLEYEISQFNQLASTSQQTPQLIQKQKELADRSLQLNNTSKDLQKTARKIEYERFELKKTSLREFAKKSQEGNLLGATWNSIVNGYKTAGLGNARVVVDLGIELLDKVGLPWASKEEMKSMTKDQAKKKVISEMNPIISKGYDVVKSKGTTEEYIQEQKKSGTLPKAWLGLAESANAIVSGGRIPAFIQGSVMGYQAINDQFDKSDDPVLRNLDENDRKIVSIPVAIINGAVDVIDYMTFKGDLGVSLDVVKETVGKTMPGLVNFTGYVLSKLPKSATVSMITDAAKELASTSTGKAILKGSEQLGLAYSAEGAAAGVQAVNEYTWKEIYNMTSDMDVFKNPELFSKQFLGKVADDINTAGVGGIILRSIGMGASTLTNSTKGYTTISDEAYKVWSDLAQDKDQRDLYFAKIKADLSSQRIPKEEAEERISTLKNAVDIASEIPQDLPIANQKEAFGILNNNRLIENKIKEIEDYVAGKNPNLVKGFQSQIDGLRNQIDANNTKLSKLSENAVQEQATSEVPVQPETGVSGEVAQGEPQPETQVTTQEGQVEEVTAPQAEEVITETVSPQEVSVTETTVPTEMAPEEWTAVQDLADRISKGEEVTSPEDLQLQQNYPKAIEKLLAKKAETKPEPQVEPEVKTKLTDSQKSAIQKGIKRGEDMVNRYPKLDDLLLKNKTLKEFQKNNQEYINADQSQKDEMTRQINFALGLAPKKSAQSAKSILGIKPTMITVDQMASLKEQLMKESKATQKGIDFANKAKKIVNDTIKKMEKGALDARATNQLLAALDGKAETAQQRSEIISKVISIFKKSEGKIAIKEADARNERIKLIDKSVKEGQRNFKSAVKEMSTIVKASLPKGKFSPSQVKVIANGLASNLLNSKIREQSIEKINRVANNVEQATKLADMYKLRSDINDARKRDLDVNITNMVNNFADIDPKFIENFDEYLGYANRVYDASKAIKFVKNENGEKVLSPRSIEDFAEIEEYSARQLEKQEEILKDNLLDQYDSLVQEGVISKDMSLQQIKDYVKDSEADKQARSDEKDKITKDFAKESFNESKDILKDQLEDGVIVKGDEDLIKAFIEMDPDVFNAAEAYEAAEALMNYRGNGSTSKMGKILANYIGAFNVKEISKNVGVEGRVNVGGTKRLRYKALGKTLDAAIRVFSLGKAKTNIGEGLSNVYSDNWLMYNSLLDNLGITYFGSNWPTIKEASGLDKIIDASSLRKTIIDQFSKEMSDKYKDKKIGKDNFFTAYNQAKLEMIARLYRETGDVKKQDSYFNDRRNVMKEGIEYLIQSKDAEENEKGQMLKDIYNELDIDNAKNGKEIFDKADPIAKEAINDFIDKFKVFYPEFAKVTQQQHNIILGKDNNYTSDTWLKVGKGSGSEAGKVFNRGSFGSNSIVDTESSGRFQKVKYPSSLKKEKGKVVSIPSYDFMQNNINALSETIGDVLSIEGLNQYEGFVNSPYFNELIKDDDSRKLFTDRIAFDISTLTDKEKLPEMSKYWRSVAKGLSYVGKIGTRAGLSSFESVATQSIPVITATAVNLRNPLYLGSAITNFAFNPDARKFINNSKYGIKQRGPSAQTSIDYADNLLKNGDYSTTDKALKSINKVSDFWVNELLVGTDVVTAKTSWLAYYMDELAKQGENPFDIDWKTHEINDKAARYAETMVQREQNANVPEMSGKLWSSRDPRMKVIRSFMPFSGFSTKQSDKIKANMSMLFKESSLATKEDKIKAARSLAGTVVEQTMFNLIKGVVGAQVASLAYSSLDKKESEKEKQLREKKARFQTIANIYESLNGGMELLEKQGSAIINNRILDFSENLYKKLESGKDFSLMELFEEEKEKKKTLGKKIGGEFLRSSSYLKKQKIKKELEKPFRFYEPQDAGLFETLFETFGGTAKVLSQSVNKNAVDGLKEVVNGYFIDKDKEKIRYTKKQKDELIQNVPFYLISIFRPGAIPREVNKEIQIERKLINESAESKNKSKKQLRKLMMRD